MNRDWLLVRHARRCLVLAALVACNSSVFDATDPEVRIETPLVWAGSRIVLTSSALQGEDTLPLVVVGRDTVTARYAAPDSLLLSAPDTEGIFSLSIRFHGSGMLPLGALRVEGGYSRQFTASSVGFPLAWPGGSFPTFLMARADGLTRVDPRYGSVTLLLPDSVASQSCLNGPGPALGGRVAVAGRNPSTGACGPLVALRPDAPSLAPDTGPGIAAGYRFAARIGPGRWLRFSHHGVVASSRDSAGAWSNTIYALDEPYAIAVSPRGDRVVAQGRDAGGRGIPVYTSASLEPAYWLTQFVELWGAQFSDDGDTLFVVGLPPGNRATAVPVLAALSASTGAVLRSATAWDLTQFLALDPGRPWLYLVGYSGRAPAVQVVDRATLTPITTMVGKAGTALYWSPSDAYPVLSAAERRLYLVDTCPFCYDYGSGYAVVFGFNLMH